MIWEVWRAVGNTKQVWYLEVEDFYRFREDQRELVHETRPKKRGEDGADDVQLLVTSGRNLGKVTKQDGDKDRLSFWCMNRFLFSIAVRFGEFWWVAHCHSAEVRYFISCADVKTLQDSPKDLPTGQGRSALAVSSWHSWHHPEVTGDIRWLLVKAWKNTNTPIARQPPIQQVIANLLCDLKVNLWPRYAGTWKSLADGWLQSTWKYL